MKQITENEKEFLIKSGFKYGKHYITCKNKTYAIERKGVLNSLKKFYEQQEDK